MNSVIISSADDGIRLDRWFKRHWPHVPHTMLQKALRKKLVKLDGKRAEASTRVQEGQELKFPEFQVENAAPKRSKKEAILSQLQIEETRRWVLFKNNDVIAINKPAGIAVQGGSGQKDHVDRRLVALQYDGECAPKLVHRLDKDTSGVLLLARSANAAAQLQQFFRGKHEMQKTYLALINGVPETLEGEIESGLVKAGEEGTEKMQVVDSDNMEDETHASGAKAKKSVTYYKVIEQLGTRMCVVELQPITGRTHQLRVHMAQMGHPIVGDGKYGGKDAYVDGSMALPKKLHLHAKRMVIEPLRLDISAPLPAHMKESFEKLEVSIVV